MIRTPRLIGCVVLGLFCMGLADSAPFRGERPQSGSSQPTFRSSTTLVQVDVIVLDKKGDFVPGLTADDLTILEDGRPQTIQQFFLVAHERAAYASTLGDDSAQRYENTSQTEDRAQRVFVIFFDEGHLANDSLMRVKKGAEQFINNHIGPGDFGGVFVNGAMYGGRLTTSRSELVAGVHSAVPAFDNRQGLLSAFRQFPRIPGEIDAVRIAEGARELAERLALEACREDLFECERTGGLGQVENMIEKKARQYVRHARVLTGDTTQNLEYVVGRLSRIPGRKTVVLLSEGFFIEDSRVMLQRIAALAARGGTAIYSIDGRGLIHGPQATPDVLSPEPARSTVFDTGEDGPTILTAGTGGLRLRNIDDISRAFNIIARDTSTYYVIGYEPDNPTLDGKFRKIEVKTGIRGLDVRARKGHVASALPPMEVQRGGRE